MCIRDSIKTILEDTTMKVSVIQMNMRSLESKANFDRAEALVRRAVGELSLIHIFSFSTARTS